MCKKEGCGGSRIKHPLKRRVRVCFMWKTPMMQCKLQRWPVINVGLKLKIDKEAIPKVEQWYKPKCEWDDWKQHILKKYPKSNKCNDYSDYTSTVALPSLVRLNHMRILWTCQSSILTSWGWQRERMQLEQSAVLRPSFSVKVQIVISKSLEASTSGFISNAFLLWKLYYRCSNNALIEAAMIP